VNNGIWQVGKAGGRTGHSFFRGPTARGRDWTATRQPGKVSQLISPVFVVPAANQNPRLRWWQWFVFGSDYSGSDGGQLQISTNNGNQLADPASKQRQQRGLVAALGGPDGLCGQVGPSCLRLVLGRSLL